MSYMQQAASRGFGEGSAQELEFQQPAVVVLYWGLEAGRLNGGQEHDSAWEAGMTLRSGPQ